MCRPVGSRPWAWPGLATAPQSSRCPDPGSAVGVCVRRVSVWMEYVRMYTVLVIRRRGWNDWTGRLGKRVARPRQAFCFLPKVDELNTLDSPARSIPQWPARRELEKENEGRRQEIRTTLVLALALEVEVGSDRWRERESGRRAMNCSACPCLFFFLFQLCNGVSVGYSSLFPSCSVLVFVLDLFPNNRLSLL